MEKPYIQSLYLKNYGCVQETTISLSRLHALIGPNDSGKSTVLRALRTLADQASGAGFRLSTDEARQLDRALHANLAAGETFLGARFDAAARRMKVHRHEDGLTTTQMQVGLVRSESASRQWVSDWNGGAGAYDRQLLAALEGSQLLRLDPDAMRQPASLIPENTPLHLWDPRGLALPGIYDAILKRNRQAFGAIEKNLTELFPSVKQIELTNPTNDTTALGVQLHNGTTVRAELVSEGMLYYLAYAALEYLDPAALLLIEEPENGLHPARIAEVMRILRRISETTQVIMATHSPLVINELKGDEVSVLRREVQRGTQVTLLKDTPNYEHRARVYANGELWVSYADGTLEAPLFEKQEPA